MNSLGQAIAMNNECVQLVQNGHVVEGLLMLQRAASALQDLSWNVVGEPLVSDMQVESHVATDVCFAREPKDSYPTEHFYVYDRLISLAPLDVAEDLLDVVHNDARNVNGQGLVVSTAVVVFNMALLQHQYARHHNGSSTTRCLMHAGFLYDRVLCLLEHTTAAQQHGPTTNASLLLRVLHCLVLNNRAHVYYETCHYTASMHCLDELCDLLVSCDNALLAQHLPDVEAAEIRRNVLYLHLPLTASSA
jgi:hypothetical protein